ncbi:MAG: hypothetical protein ABFD66_01035 [Smithella sp.]
MKEEKYEKRNNPRDTNKRGDAKPPRPENPGQRPKPTPNPPKKK